MKNLFVCMVTLLFPLCGVAQSDVASKLEVYPAPAGVELKHDFEVKVRRPGGEWQTLDTYAVKVDRVADARHNVENASLAYFDFEGEVEVSVTHRAAPVHTYKIRPLSYDIPSRLDGHTITFKLDRPRNLSVEVNGDIFHNLHLFTNPIDEAKPQKPRKAKGMIYFGPGIHRLPNDSLSVPSGSSVYIAGGARVFGTLYVTDAHDVSIRGRGIIHPEGRGAGVVIKRSKRVEVEGIISTQVPVGESDSVSVRRVKVISSYGWGDGLNVFASSHVLFDGVFCRNSDDCTTVYATRLGHRGSCKDITMQNSTLWADVAHPIMIGIHGDADHGDTIEDLRYVNIDILDHKEQQLDYQGCFAINAGDNNLIRNIRFENIRVEDFRQGQLVNIRIFYNKKYCAAPGRSIENVLFRNITYQGSHAEVSQIAGYNEERTVKNIRFENLTINGTLIYDDMPGKPKWYQTGDMARIHVGAHVENVSFVKTEELH